MVSVCLPFDALLQHLPSYLGFSYLGRGVSLHGCSSKAQPPLLTLDEGYLLMATLPDLERGVAPLGPPAPAQPLEDNCDLLQNFPCMHCCTLCPNSVAGHHQPIPLLETPGHSLASLEQSLVGSLLLSFVSWCTQGFVCALKESVSQSCVNSGGSMVGLMVTSSKRAYTIPRSTAPRAPASASVHC